MHIAESGTIGMFANPYESAHRWPKDDDEQMRLAMLQSVSEPMPGTPLSEADLKRAKLYFEAQASGSDTCGMNALNNLCQRPQFKIVDLQEAEAAHARAQEGGHFAHAKQLDLPTGFFDVEALKLAAQKSGLEIVDVEPVMDYSKSACRMFSESATQSGDGSWFLGFLVYDRRPGHSMHYYALRRDERYPGVWLRLDSLLPQHSEEVKNRRLTTEDLCAFYQSNSHHFGAWVLRWYPVIYCKGAAVELCNQLASSQSDDGPYKVSETRALRALKECSWVLSNTLTHLFQDLPRTTVRELLVRFARPSEAEVRSALEDANWELGAAQPAIDKLLHQRIARAQAVDASGAAPRALSLCDWEPLQAATLLSLQLQLQCNAGVETLGHKCTKYPLASLAEALQLVGDDVDHAEALLDILPDVGSMSQAKSLMAQTKTWSVKAARRILEVQKRFPRVSVVVALEVLKRNDEDPHAACEMLAEYQKGVQRLVLENASADLFNQGDEELIAETALNTSDWDPSEAFVTAKNLTVAVEQTRQLIRSRGGAQVKIFSVDVVLAALTAGEQKPQAAAGFLLGMPEAENQHQSHQGKGGYVPAARLAGQAPQGKGKRGQAPQHDQEEEYCSVM